MHIIYHLPLPLDRTAKSASGIRPIKILEAFYSLGYEVDIVCGYLSERKRAVNEIFKKIESGINYDFCYSESSTMLSILLNTLSFVLSLTLPSSTTIRALLFL